MKRPGFTAKVLIVLLMAGSAAGARQPEPATPRQMIINAIDQYTAALETDDRDARLERFRRAQRLFHQAIEDGGLHGADLYANLGNAAWQGARLGHAIVAYRRALLANPTHRQARQNLARAREQLPAWVPQPGPQTFWDTFFTGHQVLSPSQRGLAAGSDLRGGDGVRRGWRSGGAGAGRGSWRRG